MENTLRNIRLMTAIERNIKMDQFHKLIMEVWDLIGCDYEENMNKINRIIEGKESIEDVIEDLKYEFTSNQFMKYYERSLFNYFVKEDNFYMICNWEFIDNIIIVKQAVYNIITKDLKNIIDDTLAIPLVEYNEKIND